jgi:hypothetical protein
MPINGGAVRHEISLPIGPVLKENAGQRRLLCYNNDMDRQLHMAALYPMQEYD